jgi:O-antigen/teichoic acid export membrane protein
MQAKRSSIWKNSIFISFSTAIRLFTNFLIFVGVARLYGPEEFGQFSIAFTIANLCLIVADFGFDVLIPTEIAKNISQAVQIGKKYFSMKIILVVISSIIMISIPFVTSFSEKSRLLIFILTLYVVFTSFTTFFYTIFRGFEKFEYETKISFITNAVLLVTLAVFGIFKTPIVQMMFVFVAARFIGVILCVIKTTSLVGSNILEFDFTGGKKIINQVLIYGFYFLFGNLFFQIDTILLGIYKGDHAVGIYQSAFKIMLLVLLIPDIARNSVLPVLSRLFVENSEKWKSMLLIFIKLILFSAIPIALTIFYFSEKIISLVYGYNLFKDAVPILKIFSIVVLLRYFGEPFVLLLITSNRQKIIAFITIVATVLSFTLNYYVVQKFNLNTVAFVSLTVNLLVVISYVWCSDKHFIYQLFDLRMVFIILFVMMQVLIMWFFQTQLLLLLITIIIYFPITYFVGFSNEDRELILFNFIPKKLRV